MNFRWKIKICVRHVAFDSIYEDYTVEDATFLLARRKALLLAMQQFPKAISIEVVSYNCRDYDKAMLWSEVNVLEFKGS